MAVKWVTGAFVNLSNSSGKRPPVCSSWNEPLRNTGTSIRSANSEALSGSASSGG